MIDKKYVRGRGLFTGKISQSFQNVDKIFSGAKNRTKRDANDDKRASMTMNEGERSSHAHLYGISRGFSTRRSSDLQPSTAASMRSSSLRLFVNFLYVPKNTFSFEADIESKKIRCDRQKVC